MKRILLALTMVGLLLPLAPRAEADTEVSLDFFYDNLSPYGSWIEVSDYGYCFQPNVAVGSSDWRPYADGYWAYTDAGWTWVSYEDFGWATYHYGRWADLDDYGWVWVPGYDWGPAWVSWRTGGDYVGWAPLPPQRGEVVYEGRAITGAVDVSFDIGPLYYNFIDIRYIGEPVLRGRLIQPRQNITIINQTVNVTNITYNNSIVFNNGPDINRINRYSTRPIQRLKLQRETTISGDVGRRGNLNRVNGSDLVVAAPQVQRSKEKLAPKQVKTKVDQPRVQRGWQGVENRKQVEDAMKKENAKNVPPPTFQPKEGGKGQNAEAQPNEPGQAAQGAAENKQSAAERRAQRADEQQARQNERQQAQEQKKNAQPGGQKAERAAERQAQRADEQQARQNERQQAQEQRKNAQPDGQKVERSAERQAQQDEQQQKREAAQQEKEQRKAQQADEQRQSRQAGQEEARKNQQEERQQQRAQEKNKAQRAERQQQQEQSANDRQQKAEQAQRAESQQADRARQRAEQGQQADQTQKRERAQNAQRERQAERPQRPERPPQAQPERRQQQKAQPPQGQGDQQQSKEERKGKKKRPNDEQPQP